MAATKAPKSNPSSSSSSKTAPTSQQSVDIDTLLADPNFLTKSAAEESEFANGRVAVGAAMSFIQELQTALPPQKYSQILSLLGSYYTHSLTEKDVYVLVTRVLKGVEGEEALVKGFVRFLPSEAVVDYGVDGKGKVEAEVKKEVEGVEGDEK